MCQKEVGNTQEYCQQLNNSYLSFVKAEHWLEQFIEMLIVITTVTAELHLSKAKELYGVYNETSVVVLDHHDFVRKQA